MEDQAVDVVLADHGLPASERDAVLSYARYEALAELWALIVQAIETTTDRTASEQAVLDWLGSRVRDISVIAPPYAAIEYAKFAGKDVDALRTLINDGAGEDEIKNFLSGSPEPSDPQGEDPTIGYCNYKPPAPFESEYEKPNLSTCYGVPCQDLFNGCAPHSPTYEEFVKWGNARVDTPIEAQSIAGEAAKIAANVVAGTVVAGSASAVVLTAMGTTIFPFATPVLNAAGAQIISGVLSGLNTASLAAAVVIVIAAIAIAATAGVNVANLDQLPAKLAAAIAQSRRPVSADLLWWLPFTNGKTTLFALFADAVSSELRRDARCDNERVSQVWRSVYDNTPVQLYPGETYENLLHPCLNPVPVPPASAGDPHFVVRDAAGNSTESPTITLGAPDGASRGSVRVGASNWFVVQAPSGEQAQSLSIAYTDWEDRTNIAQLERTADGYVFHGVRQASDKTFTFDPNDCDTCWTSSSISYLGPDGQRLSATIAFDKPAAGQPTYSGDLLQILAPVTFDARDFRPGGAVGQVTYQWRFQKAGCGLDGSPCENLQGDIGNLHLAPVYLDPVDGGVATYTWPAAGTYHAQLTAKDDQGHQAVTELAVPIAPVAPQVTLARDCALVPVKVACNNYPTTAGSESILFGGFQLTGSYERATVRVDWGDGTQSTQQAGFNADVRPDSPVTLTVGRRGQVSLRAAHTYAEAGRYTVTITAHDQHGAGDSESVALTIKGPQKITFDQPADREYGDVFTVAATGTDSGLPITYTAGPGEVCTADGESGSRITAVGSGTCTVTAHQAGGGEIYLDAAPVARSLEITPASLDIRADDRSKTYGDPDPELTATLVGLKNGDTADDIGGLVLTGPPARQRRRDLRHRRVGRVQPELRDPLRPGQAPDPARTSDGHPRRPQARLRRPGAGVHRRPRRSR